MKATTNKITDLFDNIFIKSNGIIKDYVFYCSSSFPDRIEKYKGVKVYYSELIEKDIVYYCKQLHTNLKLSK